MKKNSYLCRLSLVFAIFALTGFASFADNSEPAGKAFSFSGLGQKTAENADPNLLGIKAFGNGAEIVCKLQAIEASVMPSGISIKSTSDTEGGGAFSMKVAGLGRTNGLGGDGSPSRPFISGGFGETALSPEAKVSVSQDCARIVRPELVEEYTVSGDGIRQDFIVSKRPDGVGALVLAVGLGGATSELSGSGLKITLAETGREFAYSKLLVTDASGKKLPAEFKINSPNEFIVAVNDSNAIYPVRIDPTISDASWISLFPGGIASGEAYAVAFDSSGNLYAGGSFGTAGGVTVNGIAKWNGSAWSALGTGVDGTLYALAFDSSCSNLYVGGTFTNAGVVYDEFLNAIGGAENANNIAKWNVATSTWSTLGTGLDGGVGALAFDSSGNLYVGGSFTNAGLVYDDLSNVIAGVENVGNIAKWNGSAWSALGTGVNGGVYALACDSSGDLYVGGSFMNADVVENVSNIAKWDGSAWSALGSGVNNGVYALACDSSGNLYVGGTFTDAGVVYDVNSNVIDGVKDANYIAKWNGATPKWSALGTGMDGGVYALALSADNLYVGGQFNTADVVYDEFFDVVGGVPANSIAKWAVAASTWSALGTGVDGGVQALSCDFSGNLSAGGTSSKSILKWNGSVWNAPGVGTGDSVFAFVFDSSGKNLYVGGTFETVGGVTVNGIAKWNGSVWSALGTGVGGDVNALVFDSSGNLYVGGTFKTAGVVYDANLNVIGGVENANNIAKWIVATSTWSALGTGVDSTIYALAFNSSNLYAGGNLTTAGGVTVQGVAKWNGTAWSALGVTDSKSACVNAMAFNSNILYTGGNYTGSDSMVYYGVGKWNGFWSWLGGMDNDVYAIAFDSSNNLYAGGSFTKHIARWNAATSTWSALGTGVDGIVNALAFNSGNLYAGGTFPTAGGVAVNNIAKWNVATSTWSELGTGVDKEVKALAFNAGNLSDAGNLYVGGSFTTAGGKASPYLAKCIFSAPPGVPTAVTAVGGNTKATVSFTAPLSDGGSPITSYEVTSKPGGITATGSASPIAVTRLTNGTAYTFTVEATNAIGPYGSASLASAAVTPATVPNAPVIGTATAGNGQATVTFTAPNNGGSPIIVYTVTSTPGGIVKTGTASPLIVTGLTNGTDYTFTVTATNVLGISVPSDASSAVTPIVKIVTAAIAGIAVPAVGNGSSSATATAEYTAVTGWSPALVDSKFIPGTAYTATITLTPKTGYTLTGVAANFFKVAGAATVTNPVNSGVVTAVFPKTAATIAGKAIAGVTVPVTGATPVTQATATTEYTAGITWSPALLAGKFAPFEEYTATITVTPKAGYTLTGVGDNFFTVAGAAATNSAGSGVVTAVFPKTAKIPVTAIAAITGIAKVDCMLTAGAVTPLGATVTYQWKRCTTALVGDTGADIVGATGSTYTLVAADATKFIKVEVTATVGGNYTGTKLSTPTAVIAAVVPGTPTAVTAVGGNTQATVSFTAPVSNGGSPILSYTVTSSGTPAKTKTGSASPLTVTGLTNGISYTFTVKATTAIGTSLASAASNAVTPVGPPSFTLQPSSMSVADGQPASFKVLAESGMQAQTYCWQGSTDGGILWTDLVENIESYIGVKTATLTVLNTSTAKSRYQYRCVATNGAGSTNSNAAILRVAPTDDYLDGKDGFLTTGNWSAPTMSPSKGGSLEFTDIVIGPDTVKGLEYTANTTANDDIVIREWTANVGSYTKNWEVQVDVHLADMALEKGQYANLNLTVVNAADATNSFAPDTDNMSNMCVAIDRYNRGDKMVYNFEGDLNSYYTGYNTGLLEIEDPSTDAVLRISFDCSTKELSSWYATNINDEVLTWNQIRKVNIGIGEDYDWGMTDTSTFAVFLAGGSGASTLGPVTILPGEAYFSNFKASTFAVSSTSFGNGAAMPAKYANFGVLHGDNISPELFWGDAPTGTISIAVTCIDTLPAANKWVHWMVINIPAVSTGLIEGASLNSFPAGSSELYNSFFGLGLGDKYGYGYGGPEPPVGSVAHTYVFTVYALSEAVPDQSAQQTPFSEAGFLALIEGKILAKTQLTGTFKR